MKARGASHSDGKFRHKIQANKLCFDPVSGQGTVWCFRFKETAGLAWTASDPWHAGMDAHWMTFLPDGTVRRLLPAGDDDQQRPSSLNAKVNSPNKNDETFLVGCKTHVRLGVCRQSLRSEGDACISRAVARTERQKLSRFVRGSSCSCGWSIL
jgi:hypothetical protein